MYAQVSNETPSPILDTWRRQVPADAMNCLTGAAAP